ncbi:molybdopterin molybdotransferase [Actinoalloteichus hoggarensis]|uniref:Molybdopterin molybdenumtransferase n=1 Tax=Actinoalloteichus hoggarensis TaxID=1470176 RepID=A0A221WC69_9PSEU|nr:gephyrin-like molybdotransferase Glp [Actinoalloteichus hoggarensis]ASO22877.1 Molybdopterin molybdenumtransferase [Actinoalloteichus hoggarensis]MBB5923981.1 molybdopterin molybdotransferase [Actinoalloteichus hoggarensis]
MTTVTTQPNRTSALLPVSTHQAEVAGLMSRTEIRRRRLEDCLGLALAEDLTAPVPLPPFDNSAMDGYAVHAADVASATAESPVTLPVAEDVPAGRGDAPALRRGQAHRIMTGAPLSPGADAVIPVESTDGGVAEVAVFSTTEPGRHLRRAGEDVGVGDTVARAGDRLSPARLGVAAALGLAELPVHRRPRVLVLSTGSELTEPGDALEPGRIYESNGVMLAAAVLEAGGEPTRLRVVPDDVGEFRAAVEPRLGEVDLLLTSGGVSAGAYEVVKDALTDQGVRFHKIAMQPGMPQGAGRYRGVPVVTLPGNPVSALVSFEVFVRPALLAAAGFREVLRPRTSATLEGDALRSPAGRRQYRRGRYHFDTGSVRVLGAPGSHLLSAMAESNCLLEIPSETTAVEPGTQVTVWLLDGPQNNAVPSADGQ